MVTLLSCALANLNVMKQQHDGPQAAKRNNRLLACRRPAAALQQHGVTAS